VKSSKAVVGLLSILLVFSASLTNASEDPEDELGTWLIWNGALRFSDRWSVFTDGQIRFWEPAGNLEEILLRAAGHYDLNAKMTVGLGYLYTNVWPYEGDVGEGRTRLEHRIYQQFVYRHRWGRTSIEHRFRFEQRWIDYFDETEFATRGRYRLQITVPLNRPKIEPGANFLNFYNEFFTNRGGEPSLEQNRLYAAWGRQFTGNSNLQLGLLWQHRSPGDFFRLQVFYTHNFDFR
jgi:hypothetical protein